MQDIHWLHHPCYRETSKPYSVRRRRFWRAFWIATVLVVIGCGMAGMGWIHG